MKRILGRLVCAGLVFLPGRILACPVCFGWTDPQVSKAGFYWSFLLLTVLPFALLGGIGGWVIYSTRRSRLRPRTGGIRDLAGDTPSRLAVRGH